MPKSKHRRKRHNGNKRAQRFFGNTRIWTFEADRGTDDTQVAYAQTRTPRGWESMADDVANAVIRHRNNWMICVRALCMTPAGDEWVEDETRIVRNVALNDFDSLYLDLRDEVLKAQRLDHVVDLGWIAGTFTKEARDEDLVLHKIGRSTEERRKVWRRVHEQVMAEQREEAA